MRVGLSMAAMALAILVGGLTMARADDAKATTLTGKMVCTKCTLHETDACANALQVKADDKVTTYYMVDNDVTKAEHKNVCHGPKEGVSVTGVVSEKDGKKWIDVTKIEMPKAKEEKEKD